MKEKELQSILYRDKHRIETKQTFSKQIEAMVDMVNYGSNLLVRAYDSSKKGLEDVIVIGVLLRQVILMVDAIEILASEGAPQPAYLQGRAAFEASLYIDWILMSESKKKAEYYYVSNLRNERLWTLRYLQGTQEHLYFYRAISDLDDFMEPNIHNEEEEKKARNQLAEIERVLNQEGFSEISAEFERQRNKKTGAEAYWYKPFGIRSVMKLAEAVGRVSEYFLYYSKGSELAHTSLYRGHVKFKRNKITFEPIRHLEDMRTSLQLAMVVCLSSYLSIINHYRYGERKSFATKYKNDWQDAFQNIPTVTYIVKSK